MSSCGWKFQNGLWNKVLAHGNVEIDEEADDPVYNAGSQGDCKPSGNGKKWARSRKANETPGPKMGAKPYQAGGGSSSRGKNANEPGPKQHSGAYVCCQWKQCPGVRGRPSFRYLNEIQQATDDLFCISCNAPWEWSLEKAVSKGQVPGLKPKNKGGLLQTPKPANPHEKLESPFVDSSISNASAANTSMPFTKPKATSTFAQASIPQEAWDTCPPGSMWQAFLKTILLGGKDKEEADRTHRAVQKAADQGSEECKAVIRAVIIGKAAMQSHPAFQPKPAAPTPQQPGASPSPTLEQQQKAAYTAKQAAIAEVQKAEKALNEGVQLLKQAKEEKLALEAKLAAATKAEADAAANIAPLRARSMAATEQQALLTQKLDAYYVKMEQPYPCTPPVQPQANHAAPTMAIPPGHIANAFSIDNFSQHERARLDAITAGYPGDTDRQLAVAVSDILATKINGMLPVPPMPHNYYMGEHLADLEDNLRHSNEEETCSYNGSSQQINAWDQALANSSSCPQQHQQCAAAATAAAAAAAAEAAATPAATAASEAAAPMPQEPAAMAADSERTAATKRDLEDSTAQAAAKAVPIDDDDFDEFSQEALAVASLHEPEEPAASQAKKARGDPKPLAHLSGEEVAVKLVQELANSIKPQPQQSSNDIPSASADAGASSG